MINKFFAFLQPAIPFLLILVFWYLSNPWLNPGGVLAIIPIFYCSFIRKVPYISLYSIIFCFLIDYKFTTILFWTLLYCICYSINGIQNIIDLTKTELNGFVIFLCFFGLSSFLLTFYFFSFANLLYGAWIFLLVSALYLPITSVIKVIKND